MKKKTDKPIWVVPSWMEPYRKLINNTGGNSVEDLLNDDHTTIQVNAPLAMLCWAVKCQVWLLEQLRAEGILGKNSGPPEPTPLPKTVSTLEEFKALPVGTMVYRPILEEVQQWRYCGANPSDYKSIILTGWGKHGCKVEYLGEDHLQSPLFLDYKEACAEHLRIAKRHVEDIEAIYFPKEDEV